MPSSGKREQKQKKTNEELKEITPILSLCQSWSAFQRLLLSPLQCSPEYQQRLLWFPVFHWSAGSPPAAKGWAAVVNYTVTGTRVEMIGPVHPVTEGWSSVKAPPSFLVLRAWVACPVVWKGMAELEKGFVGWTESVQETLSGVGMEPEWVGTKPVGEQLKLLQIIMINHVFHLYTGFPKPQNALKNRGYYRLKKKTTDQLKVTCSG